MSERYRLFCVKDPYDVSGTESLFFKAVKENCVFHYQNSKAYRRILYSFDFSPENLKSYDDISKIPVLPTLLFKKHRIFSMPEWRIPVKVTSSGTSGAASKIGLDTGSLFCGLHMVLKIANRRGLLSPRPTHCVILGFRPHRGNQVAAVKTAFGATCFAPALRRVYALNYVNGTYVLNLEEVLQAVHTFSRSRIPVRFMGFPSYTYFFLRMMRDRNLRVVLPKGSKLMLGGGWKQFYKEQVDKSVLYELARQTLGIAEEDIVEFFGAVEHPVLYCDCPRHHFHVPVYSRVIIRDVETLQPVENGKAGLVNLITPMVKAAPLLSVMTDDLGILHDGEECGCGLSSPYLELIGRVGMKGIKTCAAGAAEFLKGAFE